MMIFVWILLGCVIGGVVSASIGRVAVRRSVMRMRVSEKRARSAQRLAEIGSMTSGLAHEIKNPLSTIGLNAQLLGEAVEDLEIDQQEKGRLSRRVGALRSETDRLRGILEDFLEYAGELRLDTHRVDLNELIEQLADFYHVQAQAGGVQIRLDPSPDPVIVDIDANHIKQAILNLMLNAVHAMQDSASQGKELILRVRQGEGRGDRGGGGGGGGSALIHVIDTGPGIRPEDQEKIFHPYFTTTAAGTGLGLPAARRILDAHGGALELYSEPGRGSDFVLVLPTDETGLVMGQ